MHNDIGDNLGDKPFSLDAAAKLNAERLERAFATAIANDNLWLVECRDLFDAYDHDAGVYFVECKDDRAVNEVVARCTDDSHFDRLLGIFNLRKPLDGQGVGLTRSEWVSGKR
jgi:hypothetical protein